MGGMKAFATKIVVDAIALGVAAWVVSGITLGPHGSFGKRLLTLIVVAIVFGIVNALLKPVLTLFSLPLIVLTLGLFTFVINAILLQITSWVASPLHLAFHVHEFFWDAILGSIIISLVSMILHLALPDRRSSR